MLPLCNIESHTVVWGNILSVIATAESFQIPGEVCSRLSGPLGDFNQPLAFLAHGRWVYTESSVGGKFFGQEPDPGFTECFWGKK